MKCPKCGFDNRSEARFCKQCGHPMESEEPFPPPTPSGGIVCRGCGATAKPEARFCPRCGKALSAKPGSAPGQPPAQPQAPGQSRTQGEPPGPRPPSPPSPDLQRKPAQQLGQQPGFAQPPGQQAPYGQPPDQQPTYAQPPDQQPTYPQQPDQQLPYTRSPSEPPPAEALTTQGRRFPSRLWWVGGIGLFLCVISLAAVALFVKPGLLKDTEEPTETPITATDQPSAALAATDTPGVESPPTTTPVPEATPNLASEATSAPTSPAVPPQAAIHIAPLPPELRVGEKVTVTATITNTGQAAFTSVRCQLLGPWEPTLTTEAVPVVSVSGVMDPGASARASYVLEALEPGSRTLRVATTMETLGQSPRLGGEVSQVISISVIQ